MAELSLWLFGCVFQFIFYLFLVFKKSKEPLSDVEINVVQNKDWVL